MLLLWTNLIPVHTKVLNMFILSIGDKDIVKYLFLVAENNLVFLATIANP